LHEDEHLLALEKPSGLLTAPDPLEPERPSLMKLLHAGIAEHKPWAIERNLSYLADPHRLDSETSGIILLARNKETLLYLANLFGSEQVERKYVALVDGVPQTDSFETDAKLAPHTKLPHLTRVDSKRGKKSRTEFTVMERFKRWALLRCEIFTDRPHQIRVHLRSLRFPIVADALYGGQPLLLSRLKPGYQSKGGGEHPLIGRLALHAEHLSLKHPATGGPLVIKSPWPAELEVGLKYLRRYAKI
jgi:RluA family pseudouridine synthase